MKPTPVPLAVNFGQARASVGAGGSLVNLYARPAPTGAKDDTVLVGVPGREEFAQLQYLNDELELTDETNINAMIFAFDKIVVIGEHAVFLVSEDATWTRLDNGAGMSAPVSVAFNRFDVAAVNGTDGIWINESGVDTIEGEDSDFEPADTVTFLDGYMIFNRSGTGQVFSTSPYNRDINALDFADAEKAPDDAVGVLAVGDNLVIFGEETTEAWWNAANLNGFPFSRIDGAVVEHGCVSMATARQFNGVAYWLTPGGLVVASSGGAPVRISDGEVETALKERRADWADARAYIFADEGHTHYRLTVGDITLAYDLATEQWHEVRNYSRGCDLALCYVRAWGKHFVGDDQGRILEMSSEVYEDAGEPLIAEIVTMPYHNSRWLSSFGRLELQIDTGASPLTSEYHVLLAASRDGGRSWSNDRPASIGRRGSYGNAVGWNKLGARRDHRFRFTISDPFRRVILARAFMQGSAA